MSLRLNFPIPRAVTRRAPSGYRPPTTREETEIAKALRRPPSKSKASGTVSRCVPGCIACRKQRPRPHPDEKDIVQVQKEAWARIRQEEREGKRPPERGVRW